MSDAETIIGLPLAWNLSMKPFLWFHDSIRSLFSCRGDKSISIREELLLPVGCVLPCEFNRSALLTSPSFPNTNTEPDLKLSKSIKETHCLAIRVDCSRGKMKCSAVDLLMNMVLARSVRLAAFDLDAAFGVNPRCSPGLLCSTMLKLAAIFPGEITLRPRGLAVQSEFLRGNPAVRIRFSVIRFFKLLSLIAVEISEVGDGDDKTISGLLGFNDDDLGGAISAMVS